MHQRNAEGLFGRPRGSAAPPRCCCGFRKSSGSTLHVRVVHVGDDDCFAEPRRVKLDVSSQALLVHDWWRRLCFVNATAQWKTRCCSPFELCQPVSCCVGHAGLGCHHRSVCARAGVCRRGFALESAAARFCREARARSSTNVTVRDLGIGRRMTPRGDGRRFVTLWRIQLAEDTVLGSTLRCAGAALRGAADTDGLALPAARRREEETYPEFVGPYARARLVILASKVAGRWSSEACTFLMLVARTSSGRSHHCSSAVQNRFGACVGALSSPAPLPAPARSHRHRSNCGLLLGLLALSL